VGNLKFVFEIAHRPQTAKDEVDASLSGAADREAIEADHLYTLQMTCGSSDLGESLFQGKGGLLSRVLEHGHDHVPKESAASLDQVEVPQREGIETAGIEGTHAGRNTGEDPMQRL